jgi:hypothetical protein
VNDLNRYLLYCSEENPKQLDQDDIVENEEHLLRALADTGASSSNIILEAYTSGPFINTDDSNTTTWSTMGGQVTTTICL